MSDASEPAISPRDVVAEPNRGGLWSRTLRWLLRETDFGSLDLIDPSGHALRFHGRQPGPAAHITIVRWRTLRRLLLRGHVGFAEAYMHGDFETDDLGTLLTWAMRNHSAMARAWEGTRLARTAGMLQHLRRSNTPAGSRRNIEAHYDLGNEFYAHWLDAGMNYSSGLYQGPGQSLEAAQSAKLDRIIALMAPNAGDRVLEIGCGWGPLTERLATSAKCHVTGVTLSPAQLEYATKRVAHLAPRPDLSLTDYRSLDGTFDHIVSIEMIEAVGERYWPTYFATVARCLNGQGTAVLQAITIDARYFANYRRHPDFIQTHIFPGGMLPTVQIIREQAAAAGLALTHVEHFGQSYAETIAAWRQRFVAALPRLAEFGFDDVFKRKWDYYFAYCETGFRLGMLDVGLYRLARPGSSAPTPE